MATLLKVLNNLADIKSAGGVALRVRTQGPFVWTTSAKAIFQKLAQIPVGRNSTMAETALLQLRRGLWNSVLHLITAAARRARPQAHPKAA
jgi:hypothetical protein